MPRDVNGVYTLPAGNPVVDGTVIDPNWANTTLDDIAAELTKSLDASDPPVARQRIGAQASDPTLTAMAGVATAADRLIYFTGVDVAAAATLTAFARSLIDDSDSASARSTLGLGTAATASSGDFMLDAAGGYSFDAVPWNAQSGVYQSSGIGASTLIAHFKCGEGSTPSMQLKSTYANGGLWYRSSRDSAGFESDWAQVATGNLSFNFRGDNYVDFGPNTQTGVLRIGGNTRTSSGGTVLCSNGNLHIDPKDGHDLYLNHFTPLGSRVYWHHNSLSADFFLSSNGDINGKVVGARRFVSGADEGIDNSMMCTNWFRSVGATGWYNHTYGGGIHMIDATWIRTHGGKKFHVDNTERSAIDTAGGFSAWGGQAFNYAGKCAFGGVNDSWLRLNPYNEFSSGIYCGSSIMQSDAGFHVGSGGYWFKADATGAFVGGNTVIHTGNNPCGLQVWSGSTKDSLTINLPNGLYAVKCFMGDGGLYRVTFILEVDRSVAITKSSSYHDPMSATGDWEYVSYQAATNTLYYAGDSTQKYIYNITRIY